MPYIISFNYNDQINNIKCINNIKRSYSEAKIRKSINQSNFKDFDLNFDDIEEEQENNNMKMNQINKVLENFDINVFKNESKLIFLANDESVQGDITETIDGEFFTNIRSQINPKSCLIHYININDIVTYRCFLKSLNEYSFNAHYSYQDVFKKF